ncbi:hypothetical protein RHODGE_RHODGE_01024 [Rhodoplanes serenus]|uniref:Phage head morphogenesis domain-containing protein n=1 Tax=Rhodoplanes serenus TaxID=200615 RepID=A0A3S4BEF4_9BRAD|nr:phage minor head protein [Rhodoplanes serenus]VCU06584.1 hypothetical protein RHODPL_RHODPL_00032 [Rhodoplanes serenus]VCU07874.1 hypothetical protein RHODGE_RHODGE_01024 [Rhodoplanes serenus]
MASNRGIEALVEQWDPVLRRAFLAAIAAIQDRVQVSLVAELLERGDIIGAIETVGLDPVAFRPLDAAIMQAFEAGGSDTADRIPALRQPSGHRLQVRFDVRNPRAETWLREHSSALVTEIIADQRQAIRQHLTAGMERGDNPRTVAVDLVGRINPATGRREGGAIGLTAAQEEWCRRYAAELASGDRAALTRALRDRRFDRTVEKALREGAPLDPGTIAKMVAAYRNRALKYRADVIGRTEAMRALHRSQIEAFEQAIGLGQVDEAAVTKVWRSSSDARVRDSHRALHGKAVGFRAAFVSPSGARLQFPGDPDAPASETVQCRCWMSVRIDHLAAAVAAERGGVEPVAPAAPVGPRAIVGADGTLIGMRPE